MAVEPGGIASKHGGFYERRFAVEQALGLVTGRARRLRWEPASGERGGADVEVELDDGVTDHVQLRRQNGDQPRWTVAELDASDVLSAAARVVARGPSHRFVFASSVPAQHLCDICDQLSRNGDSASRFVEERVHANKDRRTAFEELLRRWSLDPASATDLATAIARLSAMRFIVLDRGPYGEETLLNQVRLALSGDPAEAVALIERFLEDHLGRDVAPHSLLEHLARQGVRPRDLSSDRAIPAAIMSLRENFTASLRERLVGGGWIARSEPDQAVEKITGGTPPRIVIVHGKPGMGKSGVLLRLTEALSEQGVPVLPISLATTPPSGNADRFGADLGLRASPASALRAVAGRERAVLLLDQLDALRFTTRASVATWEACQSLLRAALADPDTVLVLACRSFDLENDPNIARWREQAEHDSPGGVLTINVGVLRPEAVEPVVRGLGVDYSALPASLKRLLLHPAALDAWHRLARRGDVRRDVTTHTALLGELLRVLRAEAVRDHPASDAEVHAVLTRARELMESSGCLTVSKRRFDDLQAALGACCATGLLVQTGGAVSFPHQSYFDHLVARAALVASGSSEAEIVNWVRRDQSLMCRDRVRQLLVLLRDEDCALAVRVTESLLTDTAVRFHLKHLVLGVLAEAHPVGLEDVGLVVRLAARDGWADHLRAKVLWRSVPWFDALFEAGIWPGWLRDSDRSERLAWLRVVCSVIEHRPERVDELLRPVLEGEDGVDALGWALHHDPSHDSSLVAAVREREVSRGRSGGHEIFLDRLAERDPPRALRLVIAGVEGLLRRALRAREEDERVEGLREHSLEKGVAQAAQAGGHAAFKQLARVMRAAERVEARERAGISSLEDFDGGHFRRSSTLSGAIGILTTLTAHAVSGMAEREPETFAAVLAHPGIVRSEALARAVATGLRSAPESMADEAIAWLLADRRRLELDDREHPIPRSLAERVIARHAGHSSAKTLAELEEALLSHFPAEEVESYRWRREFYPQRLAHGHPVGKAQFELLSAIPESARSPRVRARIGLWHAKFGDLAAEREAFEPRGGWVRSPIPPDRLASVPDRQWMNITQRRWSTRRWRQIDADSVAEASHKNFAADFGQCARNDPGRFTRLMLRLPEATPPVYLNGLLDALADRATNLDACPQQDLEAVLSLAAGVGDAGVLRSACRVIESHPDRAWEDDAWALLGLAAAHDEPGADEYTVHSSGGADVESTSLNCVRGGAASALGVLAWNNSARMQRALPLIEPLADDPHPAVRAAAAHAAFGVYTVDADRGAALLLRLADCDDDRFLAGAWVSKLIGCVRWSHAGTLEALLTRMAGSDDPKVAEHGARWIAAEYFQRKGACAEAYQRCAAGAEPQRAGVVKTLCHLLLDEHSDRAAVEAALREYFNDPSDAVTGAVDDVFRTDGVLASDAGPRLARDYVASPAFLHHPEAVVWPLAHDKVDLAPYAEVVLAIAERFARELAPHTRSIQQHLGLAGRDLSALLLRLYDSALKHGDRALAESCLDRWDGLLENRVGHAEAGLESLPEE